MGVILIVVGWLAVLCLYLGFFIGMGAPERDRLETDRASHRRGSR